MSPAVAATDQQATLRTRWTSAQQALQESLDRRDNGGETGHSSEASRL